jgi:hypothetical protein
MTQLALDLRDLVEPAYTPEMTLADRFAAFHEQNPHVADALEALAAQWLARHSRVGMKALWERLRWEAGIRTDGQPYALNNNWPAFYARLLVQRHPEWSERILRRRALADDG